MKFTYLILLLMIASTGYAQIDALVIGDWKGSSLCQQKNSPCKDETAVYHVSKSNQANTYQFTMNKLVNGKEQEMGVLQFQCDPSTKILTSIDEQHKTVWKFEVQNELMQGTLVYNGLLYRIIKLRKVSSEK